MLWKEDQSPRVNKERKPTLRGKWDSVFSGTHIVAAKEPLETVALATDEKDDRLLPHPIRRQTARDKNPSKSQARKRKALQTKGVKFHADSDF